MQSEVKQENVININISNDFANNAVVAPVTPQVPLTMVAPVTPQTPVNNTPTMAITPVLEVPLQAEIPPIDSSLSEMIASAPAMQQQMQVIQQNNIVNTNIIAIVDSFGKRLRESEDDVESATKTMKKCDIEPRKPVPTNPGKVVPSPSPSKVTSSSCNVDLSTIEGKLDTIIGKIPTCKNAVADRKTPSIVSDYKKYPKPPDVNQSAPTINLGSIITINPINPINSKGSNVIDDVKAQPASSIRDYTGNLENINSNLDTIVGEMQKDPTVKSQIMDYTNLLASIISILGAGHGVFKDKATGNVLPTVSDALQGNVNPATKAPKVATNKKKFLARGLDKAKTLGGKIKVPSLSSVGTGIKNVAGGALSLLGGNKAILIGLAVLTATVVGIGLFLNHKNSKKEKATKTADENLKNLKITSNMVIITASQLKVNLVEKLNPMPSIKNNATGYTSLASAKSATSSAYGKDTISDDSSRNSYDELVSAGNKTNTTNYYTVNNSNKFDMQITKDVNYEQIVQLVVDTLANGLLKGHQSTTSSMA